MIKTCNVQVLGDSSDDYIDRINNKTVECTRLVVPEFDQTNDNTYGIWNVERRCCALSVFNGCRDKYSKNECDHDMFNDNLACAKITNM
ncbi:unnamed protein product [Medioppia subpectinata]|uniref:Uncharacterized protein n=1 Tax=Medioppia subpectinata TaxID=1979941 RepID=A0A7R9KYK2_9ACAR|nr:unnamed protein product [Medioppia subpectinata]CAG2112232.1 unnamed protein product [Medioppia subpectinata]